MTKVIRVSTASETNNDRVRLVFRADQEKTEYDLIWNFITRNDNASNHYFHSFNVSVASQIAQAMATLNPEHCGGILERYRLAMEETEDIEGLARYNSLRSEWGRLTMIILDRIVFCRQMLTMGTQDQDVHDMLADLSFYFMALNPVVILGLYDQLSLSGLELDTEK